MAQGFLFHLLFPESHSIIKPALGYGAGSKPKAVRQSIVGMELGRYAQGFHCINALFHSSPAGYAVTLADTDKSRRVGGLVIIISSILHNNSASPWNIAATEVLCPVAAQSCRHPCPCAASPQRVAVCIHLQIIGMLKDKCQSPG